MTRGRSVYWPVSSSKKQAIVWALTKVVLALKVISRLMGVHGSYHIESLPTGLCLPVFCLPAGALINILTTHHKGQTKGENTKWAASIKSKWQSPSLARFSAGSNCCSIHWCCFWASALAGICPILRKLKPCFLIKDKMRPGLLLISVSV